MNGGWATVQNEKVAISSTGDFSLSLDVLSGAYVAQIGFTMSGINANPATDWGNVQLTNLSATAVPELITYALILGLASFLFWRFADENKNQLCLNFKRVSMRSAMRLFLFKMLPAN